MYAFPLPTRNLDSYAYDADRLPALNENSSGIRRGIKKLPDYAVIANVLRHWLPDAGRIVEVGAYGGVLLNEFQRAGWKAVGIEPDPRAVEFARRHFGLEMRQGTLATSGISDGSVDAIVMLHVIEHIDDPTDAIARISRMLRPGGVLVCETPTYDTWLYRLLGRRERSLSCDGHIFFYTESTLLALLHRFRFEPVKIERVGRTLSLARLVWNVGVMSKSKRVQSILARLSDRFGLERLVLRINVNDMIRIYARAGHLAPNTPN
jgi:SAM-dependent methyltransferase